MMLTTSESLKKVKDTVKENVIGSMEISILDTGSLIRCKAKEGFVILMDLTILGSSRIETEMA